MTKEFYYVAFSHFFKIGPKYLAKGLARFKAIESFYNASHTQLASILGDALAQEFITFRTSFPIQKKMDEIQRKGIHVITREDAYMPPQLQQIPDPPFCLYIKGNVSAHIFKYKQCFAIVGTRRASSYGRQVATLFSRTLSQAGLSIVSGLALGIDSIAHTACLETGGNTIAVLGCGVDIIYPTTNRLLYQRIIDNNGVLLSEFPPGFMPRPYTFVMRNRLISGLCRGVLVVEGALNSGSMITAGYAAEQGRDVFAVPMPITSERAAGPNYLLRQGAHLVTDPKDILEEYGLQDNTASLSAKYFQITLSPVEKLIYAAVKEAAMTVQELVEKTTLPVYSLLSDLSSLELKGLVVKNREGKYEARMR